MQAAGGSVRHQLSDQTSALCHDGISSCWMLDQVPFGESWILKRSRIDECMSFYTHLNASSAQLEKKKHTTVYSF